MSREIEKDNGEIVIYTADDGNTKIDVNFIDDTVWLSQQQMAELFKTSRTNIVEHIGNIYDEGELNKESTCRDFRQVRKEGNRNVSRKITFYNLDMIISLGYRVKSKIATDFRKWATERLKEYIIKGFTMDDERLKNLGGGAYWKVLDLYATSIDYNPKSKESIAFFKMVQNKLHYAVHGQTAAELIFKRADSKKEFMGLTTFSGDFPTKKDIGIAKNYLTEEELKILNRLVAGYFEIAEMQAIKHKPMYMSNYVETLDNILRVTGEDLLEDAGKVSHKVAMQKALSEYMKYQNENLSPVEEDYLQEIKNIEKIAKNLGKEDE